MPAVAGWFWLRICHDGFVVARDPGFRRSPRSRSRRPLETWWDSCSQISWPRLLGVNFQPAAGWAWGSSGGGGGACTLTSHPHSPKSASSKYSDLAGSKVSFLSKYLQRQRSLFSWFVSDDLILHRWRIEDCFWLLKWASCSLGNLVSILFPLSRCQLLGQLASIAKAAIPWQMVITLAYAVSYCRKTSRWDSIVWNLASCTGPSQHHFSCICRISYLGF